TQRSALSVGTFHCKPSIRSWLIKPAISTLRRRRFTSYLVSNLRPLLRHHGYKRPRFNLNSSPTPSRSLAPLKAARIQRAISLYVPHLRPRRVLVSLAGPSGRTALTAP